MWAIGGAYASYLIDEGASFVELTEARAWITALVLLAFVGLRRNRRRSAPKVGLALILLFGSSIAAANFTYYASLSRLPVAIAITIQYTAPGLVVLWMALAERQPPTARVVVALAGAMAGVALLAELPALIAEGKLRLDALGLIAAGGSAFAFATYMVSGQRIGRRIASQEAVFRGFVVASVLWAGVQIARGRPDTLLDARFTTGILFLAFATTIAPFLLFVWGLQSLRASDAGIVSTLEPLAATLIALVWLDQTLSGWQLAGAGLVVLGIGIVQAERPAPREILAERAAVE